MSSPEEWYKQLPLVTKVWLTSAFTISALTTFGFIDAGYLYMDITRIFGKFEIWRLVTCFMFFGTFSFPCLIQLFILQRYCNLLERGYYSSNRGTAEMVFLLLCGAFCFLTITWLWKPMPYPGPGLVFMVLYVWSRKNPYLQLSFWGFKLLAWHLPFFLCVLYVLLGSSPVLQLIGIVIGHLYHFLVDVVPNTYGVTLLKTPDILYAQFDSAAVQENWRRRGGHRLN